MLTDIAEHGVQQPIIVDEHGTVIDGHHREAIARELGVECPRSVYPGYTDEQKRSLAIRLNLHRRQLSKAQRDEVIVTLRREGMTQQDIAKEVRVDQKTVSNVIRNSPNEDQPETIVNSRGQIRPASYDRQAEPTDDAEPPFAPGEKEAILDLLHEEHGDDIPPEALDRAFDENLDSKQVPERKAEWTPTKPDLGDGVSHPARYSPELVPVFAELLRTYSRPDARVLDPFAGTGRIHELHPEFDTVGIEIEPEWAQLHERTLLGTALDLPFDADEFDAVVTSPTYGNRLADSHNASDPERRRSYTHDLGRPLHDDNSGDLHWRNGYTGSEQYRIFHERAWAQAISVLKIGGVFILNIKDHWRDRNLQLVPDWHCWCLGRLGLDYVDSRTVGTHNLRQGANGDLRSTEEIYVFRNTGMVYAISHWTPS